MHLSACRASVRRIAFLSILILGIALVGTADEPRGPRLTRDQIKQLEEAQRHGDKAGKLAEEGKSAEAIREWNRKLVIERRIFGQASPPVVHSLQVLARMELDRDGLTAARNILQEVVRLQPRLRAKRWQIDDARRAVADVGRLARLSTEERRRLRKAHKLNREVLTLFGQGKAAAGLPLAKQVVKIRKEILGDRSLDYAKSLSNLATIYKDQSEWAKADPLYEQVVVITRRELGENHPSYGNSLNNLGLLYQAMGAYDKAEDLLHKGLDIKKRALGEKHPEYAQDLNNLAGMYWTRADYAKAEPLFQKALAIRRQIFGDKHPQYATALSNLGLLYRDAGMFTKAEPLLRKAILIRKEALGEKNPDYAASLINLATMFYTMHRYNLAEPIFQKALKSARLAYGDNHPDYAASLMNLASIYDAQGAFSKAEPLLARAVSIYKKSLGNQHPDTASAQSRLAWVYASTGRASKAAAAFDEARRGLHAHAARVLPGMPEAEQLTFLYQDIEANLHGALSFALAHRDSPILPARSAAWVLNAKGLTADVLAEPALLARDRGQRALGGKVRDLISVRHELADLTFTPVPIEKDKDQDNDRDRPKDDDTASNTKNTRQEKLERLYNRADALAKQLSLPVQPWVELARVRKALPAGAILIDLVKVAIADFKAKGKEPQWKEPHYVAWVVPSTGIGRVQIIDLGEAKPIEEAVRELTRALRSAPDVIKDRGEILAEKQFRAPLERLARLVLHPLTKHLTHASHWIFSPDSALWQVPWAALPLVDGAYAIERCQVTTVVSGRDLLRPRSKPSTAPALVLADPDYDGKATGTSGSSAGGQGFLPSDKLPVFKRPSGAAAQAKDLPPLVERYAKTEPVVLTGKEARERAFKAARRPRVVVLAAQSYYLENQNDASQFAQVAEPSGKSATDSAKKAKVLEDPLLRGGLALAGANHRLADEAVPSNDGILTGFDIVGVDLRGTELVLLPAAAASPVPLHAGEAMGSLQAAFQLAGAPAVIAAAWQLPAAEKVELLTAFFDNLAVMKLRAKALRQAQLAIIKKRRDDHKAAHPYYWAGFALTGRW